MAMTAAVHPLDTQAPAFRQTMNAADRSLLEHLRVTALDCRAAARADLFEACAMLAVEKPKAREAHAKTLIRTLSQILGKAPRFHRPGVAELSFDEDWLVALSRAVRREDHDSIAFLLRSRVPQHARRSLLFLMAMVSENFRQV
ncbi:hypothetical protein P1J78_21615 [Psychromarinibacter sp. C21-152]|uniref:Uncharacterized protein n=1 Tax=Psychromarinibacter sediminicola TaxID=3033385 RepID=A0AAE3TA53_9RHOB|nr:hypothetical protein [Psychromarinibacter sediminicola]MDF0603335.1 hypothetical protein [Psychromarinibacter sediminicola]